MQPAVLVVGAGSVGSALSRALRDAGMPVALVSGRDLAAAGVHLARAGPRRLLVLAVPDRAVESVAADLAGPVAAVLAGPVTSAGAPPPGTPWAVVHCSGALGLDVLDPLAALGCSTGCWHPLQAFPTPSTAVERGITWAVTATEPLAGTLAELTGLVGGIPLRLAESDKVRYHAAAALAANYTVTLAAHATALLGDCGLAPEAGLRAVLPLLRTTLAGLDRVGLPDGLTGPLARGDLGTVTRHLDVLAAYPDTLALYRAAGRATLTLLARRGMPADDVERARALLAEPAVTEG
ncbi:MAG: Rossmann-like and DUF2520 domain-containing protein [Dermatophilaceae bacterium]